MEGSGERPEAPLELLVLVPTALERERLEARGGLAGPGVQVALCGFGPVAAAATTSRLLASTAARRVALVGVAGTYDPEALPIGAAAAFGAVRLDGVGAGQGSAFAGPRALGFAQLEPSAGPPVFDELPLDPSDDAAGTLVTACAAALSASEVEARLSRHPGAVAEDMEAFGVALACHLFGKAPRVVRGISNRAGERSGWRLDAALAAARELLLDTLRGPQ